MKHENMFLYFLNSIHCSVCICMHTVDDYAGLDHIYACVSINMRLEWHPIVRTYPPVRASDAVILNLKVLEEGVVYSDILT